MKTKKSSGNRLKAYFSKPANVITVIFFVILVAAVILPLFTLLLGSVTINGSQEAMYVGGGVKNGDLTSHHWWELLFSKEYDYAKTVFWRPLGQSALMALYACLIAVLFGGIVAWFITRSDLPFKKFISTVFVFPYIMPSWAMAMFWENFYKNDCEADIRQSYHVAESLMSYLRVLGDGPHFYKWQRHFQKGAGGDKVHLILRVKAHLSDLELWELMEKQLE